LQCLAHDAQIYIPKAGKGMNRPEAKSFRLNMIHQRRKYNPMAEILILPKEK